MGCSIERIDWKKQTFVKVMPSGDNVALFTGAEFRNAQERAFRKRVF